MDRSTIFGIPSINYVFVVFQVGINSKPIAVFTEKKDAISYIDFYKNGTYIIQQVEMDPVPEIRTGEN